MVLHQVSPCPALRRAHARVTGDEAQGTMGRVKKGSEVSPVFSFPPSVCAQIFIERETSCYEAGSNYLTIHLHVRFVLKWNGLDIRYLSWRAVNLQMNRTVKYPEIYGVCGQAFTLLPSISPFNFFCSRSNFRASTGNACYAFSFL